MEPTTLIPLAGLAVGVLYGIFGVGSAFATPMLSVIGVSGMAAVVAPLPGLLPGSAAGAWSYSRGGHVDWVLVRRTLTGALPAAVAGAIASRFVGGPLLLVLSGLVLLVVGARVLRSRTSEPDERAVARRDRAGLVIAAAAAIGFSSGLLANGGGFLLVPLFLLALGLDMHKATGTSMVVAAALTMPTLLTHAVMGDIDWGVALLFAGGLVPGAMIGGRLSQHLPTGRLQRVFGVLLVGFAVWFLVRQIVTLV